jgi:predicted lipoprotein
MMSSWKQRGAVVLAAASLVCTAVPMPASAHTMPPSTAMTVAKQAVAKIKRETHAASARVTKCARKSQHRFLCKGQEHYRTGASLCTFDITVRYTSPVRRTTKYDISNYRCF